MNNSPEALHLRSLIKEGEELGVDLATFLLERGVYFKEKARWKISSSYQGKNKDIYTCSRCGHWQSVKKSSDQVMYMKFCPFCGAKMEV